MFNKGEGGFRDRDLYVFCANASDGILTAHPALKGEELKHQGQEGLSARSRDHAQGQGGQGQQSDLLVTSG
jgi:hypothetical protein